MTAYQLVVFDWDGTLMNSVDHITWCLREALQETGLDDRPDHELQQVIGLGLDEAMRALVPGMQANFYDSIVASYRHHWLRSPPGLTRFFEGIPELLNSLHDSGFPMAIATGKSRRGLDKQLVEENISHMFAATRCADESESKPAPDMLLEIMQELGTAAENTLVVGDTEFDMQMAHTAGCDRIAVSYGVHDVSKLSPYDPLMTASSPRELISWFERNILASHN